MIIIQIIGIIIVTIIFSFLFLVFRSFMIYTICKDMTEKEQDDYLKEVEKSEAEYLRTHKDI